MVIAAILHASCCALPTTKDSNQATLANVASTNIDGRSLRRVNKGDELEQEERSAFKNFGEFTKKYGKKFGKWFVNGGDYRVKDVKRSWI
ncbi:hypothetical protein GN244_ATG02993 [Phytophthora infestans]|uniref:RxLR effector protein n=1 Tax=Phytophthora infestans TaxID=4787 RepID=A0A833X0S5_PHYIN|nr:hypothetical protein GN244_ATG02993 [Phytophthora infestans]KAF4148053.1 hypothetical protein GN958_ATG02747 [Phytophthora infestans]